MLKSFSLPHFCSFLRCVAPVIESELPVEMKDFLWQELNKIIDAISKYKIYGTEGLETAIKEFTSDFICKEQSFNTKEKKRSTYRTAKSFAAVLAHISVTFFFPSVYDLIGAAADIEEYWLPKIEGCISFRVVQKAVLQ